MGSISTSTAGLAPAPGTGTVTPESAGTIPVAPQGNPGASSQTQTEYEQLSNGAVDGMRQRGIPEAAIEVANGVVGTVRTAENGGFEPAPPAAAAQDTAQTQQAAAGTEVDPALDQPDKQYTGLLAGHVMVLRAAGTTDEMLAYMDQQNYNAGYVEEWLANNVVANPEWWDTQVTPPNPIGTARAGLHALLGDTVPAVAPGSNAPTTPTQGPYTPTVPTTQTPQTTPTTPVDTSEVPELPDVTPVATPESSGGFDSALKGGMAVIVTGALAYAGYRIFKHFRAPADHMRTLALDGRVGITRARHALGPGTSRGDALISYFASDAGPRLRVAGVGPSSTHSLSLGGGIVDEHWQTIFTTAAQNGMDPERLIQHELAYAKAKASASVNEALVAALHSSAAPLA